MEINRISKFSIEHLPRKAAEEYTSGKTHQEHIIYGSKPFKQS